MTDQNLTHLLVISDRSGSMEFGQKDAEGGINAFIDEHKKAPGNADITFVEFDTRHDTVYSGPIKDMPRYQLLPRGGTALLDAIGFAVTGLGVELAARPEDKRPGAVIVVVSTDGEENSSYEWEQEKVKDLLKRQQDDYSWKVIFLGANIDAVTTGASYGISAASSMTFDMDNVIGTYAMAAANTTAYRGSVAAGASTAESDVLLSFTPEQRKAALKK
jgi:hypothetical protein